MTFSYVDELVKAGHFAEIDAIFAKWLMEKVAEPNEEQGVLIAALFWASRQGHLCLSIGEDLFSHLGEEKKKLMDYLEKGSRKFLPIDPFIRREGDFFYLQRNWVFETRLLFHFKRLISQPVREVFIEKESALTDEQQASLVKTLSHPFSIICGGPGTGKTFTAAKIVDAFLKQNPEAQVVLAAPTGKASRELKRRSFFRKGVNVCTLHSLLGIHKESPSSDQTSPLMADLLIIDESSMVDARLFSHLFSAIKMGTHLVLMGDPHQLPAVENGSLFADLVDLLGEKFPANISFLTQCHRSDRQEILQFMQAVLSGKIQNRSNNETLSFFPWDLVPKEAAKIYEKLEQIAELRFPSPSSTQQEPELLFAQQERFALLSCLRKGPFGVDALNQMLAAYFLHKKREGEELAMPILITRSDEKQDLYNGEAGFLIRSSCVEKEYAIFKSKPDVRVPAQNLPAYEYAYALSVHKSQGSEYDEVLLLIPPGSDQLGKEVIYTGASRAKKRLQIAGSEAVLKNALLRASRKISALHARLTV